MAVKTPGMGVIGCGFMGRAHSKAYRRLNNFFPVEFRPVLKAIYNANTEKARCIWLDDCHALGVLGANGRGTYEHYGLHLERTLPAR
jgi:hypothetical protein